MAEYKSELELIPIIATNDADGHEATIGGDFVSITWENYQKLEKAILENRKNITDQGKTQTEQGKAIEEHAKSIEEIKKALEGKADGLYVDPDTNELWLKSGDKLIGSGIQLPKNGSGIPNVSELNKKYDYSSNQEAREALPEDERMRGQLITYQLDTGIWVLDHFVGDSTGSWSNDGSWRSYLTSYDISQALTDIETIKSDLKKVEDKVKNIPDDFEIDEENKLYLTSNGERINDGVQLPEGGGGSGSNILMSVRIVGISSMTVGEEVDVPIKYSFTSIERDTGDATGPGTFVMSVNGINVQAGVANQGENTLNLKGLIYLGSNVVKVRVVDSEGNAKTVTWNIQVATLRLTSTFADDTIYNTNPVLFRYTPVGIGVKTIRFFLDGVELASEQTDTSGRQMTKQIAGLTNGDHSLRVFAESTIEGSALKSNELYYEFIFADETAKEPVIALSYNKDEVQQFTTIDIPYIVFNPSSPTAAVTIRVNGQVVSSLDVPRTKQHFTYVANTEGLLIITFTCGTITKTLNIQVIASGLDITEETADLEYKAFAVGKSNSSVDRDSWNYNGYTADFENFTWADDGWQKDDNGNSCLKLIGDSKVKVGITPFTNNLLVTGSTLTFEYSTSNVTDDNAVIISSMIGDIGLELTPTSVKLQSAQSILEANFDSQDKISISIVIQKLAEDRLLYLLVDGIASGTLQFPASDNFTQSAPQPFTISTGERACRLNMYGIRWYRNSLNFEQVLGNYIYDIEAIEEKIAVYAKNRVTDEYGNIDYNKALQFLPCMTIVGDLPNYKGDKKNCDIIYENQQNPALAFTATAAQNDVQGTSSQYYPRKNYKIKFNNGLYYTQSGVYADGYAIRENGIPTKAVCMKADFAESSGTHNTGLAVIIDIMLRKMGILVPPQLDDERVRTTIDGYPCLIFHKANAGSASTFVGKYNFNYDKGSEEAFGFQDGDVCWEFMNNTSPICLFKSADFSGNWLDTDLEARYPDGYSDGTKVAELFAWVVSCIGNPAKFKSECANYFNVQNLLSYELKTEFFACIDQKAKNMMLVYYKLSGRWFWIFYDNDTFGGINNEGRIEFSPFVEIYDTSGSGHVFNGYDSELWKLVREAYPAELETMYQQMRQQQILTLSGCLDVLQGQQADKWCELIYNHDGKFKYVDPLIDGYMDYSEDPQNPKLLKTGAYLYALQGSRSRHRIWWLTNRFSYMDSKYNASSHINDYATMRLYTPVTWGGVAPNPDFKISMIKPGYFRVKYGSYMTDGVRGFAGQTYDVTPPNPNATFNDTETIIYGVSAIRSLGDLSNKYAGTVDITRFLAIEDLILGSTAAGYKNENLSDLHTGNNERLKIINVANCPNLKQSLDLSKCYSLEEIEARGSGLTGFELPRSGVLKKAYLPASFAALILKNQPYLDTLVIEDYANLNTVILENVPDINGYNFVRSCVNTAGSKLNKVRITDINANDTSTAVLNALAMMTGEDENGLPTDVAVVTGKIHIASLTNTALNRLSATFPYLQITYSTLLDVIDFEDNIVRGIMVERYDSNGDGEISPSEVATAVIPSGLLTGTGARRFNEAHNWGGSGSVINDCETLEAISILTGKVTARNLTALKSVRIVPGPDEQMDASPLLLTEQPLTNCYAIENWTLEGRYVENSNKGAIIGRTNGTNGTYYILCMPLLGYSVLRFDENLSINDTHLGAYQRTNEVREIIIDSCFGLNIGNGNAFQLCERLYIRGSKSPAAQGFSILGNNKIKDIIIDGSSNPFILGNVVVYSEINKTPVAVNLKIGDNVTTSTIYRVGSNTISGQNTVRTVISRLDLGVNVNMTIVVGQDANTRLAPINTIIIRNPNAILPLVTQTYTVKAGQITTAIYVPDDLVDAYKIATNWSVFASLVKPLSLLND